MGRKRNQYTKEYKTEAVRLIVEEGRSISEVARELGIALQEIDPNLRTVRGYRHLKELRRAMKGLNHNGIDPRMRSYAS